jgi:osmotically-inducible protein OsmY
MNHNLMQRISRAGSVALLVALFAFAQEPQPAGGTLGKFDRTIFEQTIHDRLGAVPSYGVFDTVGFEVRGQTVILSGQVVKESVKQNAERAARRIDGVANVVNQIEVLPASKRDDALRTNMYRALYEKQPLEKFATGEAPPIHIIVKNGWVTLEGVVHSDADRSAVHLKALGVTAHVSENLRVIPRQ